MIIWVDDLIFREGSRDADRVALLRNAAARRHTLIVSADPDTSKNMRSAPHFDAWLRTLNARLSRELQVIRERLHLVSAQALAYGAGRILVSARELPESVPGCQLTLEEAVRAVALPTYLLVENALNDRAFLLQTMPPVWRDRLKKWENSGMLRFEHGGGNSEAEKIIRRFQDDNYSRQAFGLPARVWLLVHCVVYDHDGGSDDFPGTGSKSLELSCKNAGIHARSHRLCRKDQEHYLPKQALMSLLPDRGMSEAQRATAAERISEHFDRGPRRHFDELRLSDDGRDAFSNTFKNKFEAPINWSDDWFQQDGAWPEMARIAEIIAASV